MIVPGQTDSSSHKSHHNPKSGRGGKNESMAEPMFESTSFGGTLVTECEDGEKESLGCDFTPFHAWARI